MKTIIWPVYINSNHSRGEGRRLSIEDAVEDPKVREISQVLRKLNIEHSVEHAKAFPGSWWEHSGRVEAERGETSKIEFLRLISKNIKASRRSSK
ncbi:MAG: signal recognition particle protein Srp19 [Methanosphaera stadtmanae]|jgi:signal recognition particle subunit SRP19|nr:signal recognition particle protein Srp19 [Methanosphaera stadtmanae]